MKIPQVNPKANLSEIRAEITQAIAAVIDSGQYIHGPQVEAFEAEFAEHICSPFAIGTGNGTDALRIALLALGIKPGDEVITVSHTAVATVAAVASVGAVPVFADIHPDQFTLDPESLRRAFSTKTRAVIAVHLYGNPVPIDDINLICAEKGVPWIADCAQALGATYQGRRVGRFASIACFSFYPTKNLGALGDGGMIVTADPHLAAKCRRIREYGWKTKFISEEAGINSRLDEMHAAILRVKLPHVDRWNHLRQNHAQYYDRELADLPVTLPTTEPKSTHAYHQYVLKCDERDGLREFLAKEGIGTAIHYPVPVHRQPAYKMLRGVLPHTEAVAKTILSLPMFPELQPDALQTIVQSMKRFFYGTRKHSAVRGAGAHRQTAHSLE